MAGDVEECTKMVRAIINAVGDENNIDLTPLKLHLLAGMLLDLIFYHFYVIGRRNEVVRDHGVVVATVMSKKCVKHHFKVKKRNTIEVDCLHE